jgi:hypothetical protein
MDLRGACPRFKIDKNLSAASEVNQASPAKGRKYAQRGLVVAT